jgi:hypothetical protein
LHGGREITDLRQVLHPNDQVFEKNVEQVATCFVQDANRTLLCFEQLAWWGLAALQLFGDARRV